MQLKPEELRTVLHLDYWRDKGRFQRKEMKRMITTVFSLCVFKARERDWRARTALCSNFLFYLTSGVPVVFGKGWSDAAKESECPHKVRVVARCWGGRTEWGLTRRGLLLEGWKVLELQSGDSCIAQWVCYWPWFVGLEMVTTVNVTALKAPAKALPWEGGYEEPGVLASTKSQKKDRKGEKNRITLHSTTQSPVFIQSCWSGFVLVLFRF